MWWIGYTNQRDAFDCRDDGYAVARPFVGTAMFTSGGASGLFSNWNARADLEDARNVVIDRETIAALQMHGARDCRPVSCPYSTSGRSRCIAGAISVQQKAYA